MRISLAQLASGADPTRNLELVAEAADAAALADSRLLVLPAATMRRFGLPLGEVAEPVTGPWADAVRTIAREQDLTVVVGMFTPAPEGRVHNTLLVTGPGVDTHYDKIHLYDAFGFTESRTVAAGSEPVVFDVDGVRVGLAPCYDIRFPGLFQTLADRGAALIAVSASWGDGPGKVEQWELLARARALDSTSYVAACGQPAPGEPASSGAAPTGVGHSLVAAPDGSVVDGLGAAPGMLTVDIDPARVQQVRRTLPVLSNRRW